MSNKKKNLFIKVMLSNESDSAPLKVRLYPLTAIIGENLVGKGILLRKIRNQLERNDFIMNGNSKTIVVSKIINESSKLTKEDEVLGLKIIEKFQTPLKKKEFSKKEFDSMCLSDIEYEEFDSRFWRIKELFGHFLPLTSYSGNILHSIGLKFVTEYLKFSDKQFPIFFFEEPEIHLHPQGQIHFLKVLKKLSNNAFFVYTTHSPFMINGLAWESIIKVLKGSEKEIRMVQVKPGFISKKVPFHPTTNIEITTALFSRVLFLVEGETEKVFINTFFRKSQEKQYDPILDLAEIGVTLLPVYGNHFNQYLRLFSSKGFNLPIVILTDNDSLEGLYRALREINPEIPKASKKNQIRNILQKNNCFVMQEDFEKDFLYKSPKLVELVVKKYFPKLWKEIKYKAKSEKELKHMLLNLMRRNKVSFAYYLALEARVDEVPIAITKAIHRVIKLAEKNMPQTLWNIY